jgi:serine/threonine-protein kinase RsbW
LKVFLVADNDALEAELSGEGAEVVSVTSPDEVSRILSSRAFDLAVVDEALPDAHRILITLRTEGDGPDHSQPDEAGEERGRLPVVLVSSNGSAKAGVRCVPDATLNGGGGAEAMVMAERIIQRRARQRPVFDQELLLRASSTPEAVDEAGDLFERLMERAGFDEELQVKLVYAVREALGNAREHGNKNDPERDVHVSFLRSPERVLVVVRDEGPGFDTTAFLARADQVSALEHTRSRRSNEVRPGGLGVFAMKETCDAITFNDSGNAIYLMKFLPGKAPS